MSSRVPESIAGPDAEESTPGQGLDLQVILIAVRYWWRVAMPLALLLAALAAGAVAYFSKPAYTASAWLIIREKPEYLLNPNVMEDPRKFVQNQMELMRSPPVIDPVANKPEVFATPELAIGDAAERLRRQLRIRAMGQSDFFVIEFTSEEPKKAALIVNEVKDAYLKLQDRDLSQRMEETIKRLERLRADQQALIERLRDQVQTKTRELTGVDPYALKNQVGQIGQDPLSPLQSQIVDAEIAYAMATAQVEAEEELLKNQAFEVPAGELEEKVQAVPEIAALSRRIRDAQALIKEHERTSVNLARNPGYQHLAREKARDEEMLEKRLGEVRPAVKAELENAARLERTDQVASMRRTLDAKRLAVDILRERIQKERSNQQHYKGETVELEFLRADYESAARVFSAIDDRIVSMRLEQHAPDRVMSFKDAEAPAFPDAALPYRRMGVVALAAFLAPFGLAVGYELLHRRVNNRRQLELISRVPVVAEVTAMPRQLASASAANQEQANRELQLFEECIYGLRTHLMLANTAGGLRTIVVTSAVSREGKTSVAVQLALSIARSTGERTLLIDGDLRCPDVHRIFEIERAPGVAEVLQKTATLDDAIEKGFSPSLHLLVAGRLATVPHRLLGNATFPRLLDELKKKYRYIVIDTPPILPASEALMMARAADVTVVCARRDFSKLDQVVEAHGRLQTAGVRVAGTVLNGISPQAYAYRYGSYYYDRGLEQDLTVMGREG
jgi:polysaccharide biosynthesis transport protein